VTDEIAPKKRLDVRPLVNLTSPSGEVRPVSVTQMMRVPAAVVLMSIVLVSREPEVRGGVPATSAETLNESVAPQQVVAGRESGLPPVASVVKVGGKVGDSPPLIVIVSALAPEVHNAAVASSAPTIKSFLAILRSPRFEFFWVLPESITRASEATVAQSGRAARPQVTLIAITSMSRYFQTWAIYKYTDYLTHKLTASTRSNRYCNWCVV
jgi:hypothetical protein